MFKKSIGVLNVLHGNESGSYFVEMALVLIGVALAVFSAANSLSTGGIVPKYNAITTEINSAAVPDIGP